MISRSVQTLVAGSTEIRGIFVWMVRSASAPLRPPTSAGDEGETAFVQVDPFYRVVRVSQMSAVLMRDERMLGVASSRRGFVVYERCLQAWQT